MVMVNRIITAREEEELSRYVKQRLSRTRSGHPFVKDTEAPPTQPLPSALKKAGAPTPSPKSPKDKVTFAEFKNEVFIEEGGETVVDKARKESVLLNESELNSILKESQQNGGGLSNGRGSNGHGPPQSGKALCSNGTSHPPSLVNIPQISICEPSSESGKESTVIEEEEEGGGMTEGKVDFKVKYQASIKGMLYQYS